MACSSACPTQNCPSYGACLRRKGIQVADVQAHQNTQTLNRGLNEYREAREAGLQPDGTNLSQVRKAWQITDATGVAYRGDQG